MKNMIIDGVEYTPVVNEENKRITQTFDFEIHPTDLGIMDWHDAMKACKALGDGWRLPTRIELLLIYENRDRITLSLDDYYWSSTKSSGNAAWIQYFDNGKQYNYGCKHKYNVRAIRTT